MPDTISKLAFSLKAWPSLPLFFILRHGFGDRAAIIAALLYTASYLLAARQRARQSALDLAVLFFWGIWLAAFILDPERSRLYLHQYFTTFFFLCLFCAAAIPPLLGKEPFTTSFARRRCDPAVWKSRQFRRINLWMTTGWAAIFGIGVLLSLLPDPRGKLVAPIFFTAIAGIPFTRKFPAWYLAQDARRTAPANPLAPVLPTPRESGTAAWPANHATRPQIAAASGPITRALVIFGSPRGAKGHTHAMLQYFLNGLSENGVAIETVCLAEHKIRPCSGCFSCWTRTPGVCIHKDDMAGLLEKEQQADLIIFAQPLYVFSVPGITKNYLDRRLPQLLPYLIEGGNGVTSHPPRWPRPVPARLLVFSVCGFPEVGHFAGLVTMFRQLAATANTPIIGELLRPASEALAFKGARLPVVDAVTAALYQAGCQVARQGYINKETEAAVSQPLVAEVGAFQRMANAFWDSWIAYEQHKKQAAVPESLPEHLRRDAALFFAGMAARFRPEATDGAVRSIQFHLLDQEPANYSLCMANGRCRMQPGAVAAPDLIIHTPWQTWLDIAGGALSGRQALLEGRFRIDGDIELLQLMPRLFDGQGQHKAPPDVRRA